MHNPYFSILIPTWNNIEFLKLCIRSIRTHSTVPHEIIIHVNEGTDGTLDWVKNEGLKHTHSSANSGVCIAMNKMAKLAESRYILYLNDDMYVLPEWDNLLKQEIESLPDDMFYLSSTSIEAKPQSNCMIQCDFGDSIDNFEEEKLLSEFNKTDFHDWSGSTWPPCVVSKRLWDKVGGYSEEFSPGMYSDPDFSMKLWQVGVRHFMGLSYSRVYHFGSKSVGRVKKNNGRKQFIKKWGITPSSFSKYYLLRGKNYKNNLDVFKIPLWIYLKNKFIMLIYYIFKI
jgi:glycosyltransferase involved in cell wall biosynthesis